jgi:hypothetical protein
MAGLFSAMEAGFGYVGGRKLSISAGRAGRSAEDRPDQRHQRRAYERDRHDDPKGPVSRRRKT